MGLGSGRRINNNINNKQSDRTSSTAAGVEVAPFLKKTYEMVDDSSTDSIVSWSPNNKSFIVLDMPLFSTDLLPKYFKHNNFNSFVRQLNTYGFRKVSELWEFANDGFLRGHKHLLTTISRRKPAHSNPNTIQQSSSLKTKTKASCVVEIAGNFGIEQEVDRLKRDKNVLMQQLVRLRHQQQTTDNQLHGVGQRVQLMEQRQQQMMSFLAKAMHNPALLAQLSGVHNHPNHDRHISGVVNKKRRLPNHDEHPPHHPNNLNATATAALSDGHIIKYQPLINEAAKSMLRQILKMSAPLPDHSFKDPNAFLIDHLPTASAAASSVVDSANSAARFSEVTLSDVTHNSNHPCFPADTGSSVNHQPTLNPETLASSCVSSDSPNQVRSLEADVHTSLQEAIMSDFDDQMQGVQPESSLKFPDLSTSGTHNSVLSFLDSLSTVDNGTLLVETDMFAQDAELNAGILPGSNDAFWEQFFPVGPLPDAAEEVDSSAPEGSIPKDHELGSQDEALEELHHMSHLTEQMGLLSAEAGKV